MSVDVDGKVVLVTGANRGIGRSIVDAAISQGATKVYAAVRDIASAQPLIDEHGERIVPVEVDLTKPETITAAAETATDVEIVINNAGVLTPTSPSAENVIESFQFEIDVNVYGLIRVANAFSPLLKANNGGALVQLNSVASLKAFPDFATYCASKAASYSITQALKDKLAEQGTAVVSVHPGPIDTDMADSAGLDADAPPSVVAESIFNALRDGQFHAFPDPMAQQIGGAYQSFAEQIVEANLMEGEPAE